MPTLIAALSPTNLNVLPERALKKPCGADTAVAIDGDRVVSGMDYFRIYVYDKTKRLLRTTDLIAENKIAALTNARDFLTHETQWFAFELWQNARRVHKEIRNIAEVPPPVLRIVTRLEVSPPPVAAGGNAVI